MENKLLLYAGIMALSVLIASVSQVMLKKASMREYASPIREYLNPLVITAYGIFFGTTFLTVLAYKVVPLSLGPVIESTSYIYVTVFGVLFFKEKLNLRKLVSLALIVGGILVYSFFG